MPAFKDHFSLHSGAYALHRPTYPAELVEVLARTAPATSLALDCGCGTGQLSVLLAGRFSRVEARDASAEQIRQAEPHPSIDYRVAPAERSGLPDRCVDLVTAAQAAHWFDLDPFYAEARRVARPGAAIALVTYGVFGVEGAADRVMQRFYRSMGPYWPPERRHVEEGYRGLPFPFAEVEAPPMAIEASWSLAGLIGYVDTWSAVRAAERATGRGPIERFQAELAEAWGAPNMRRAVRWPLSLRLGRL